MLSALLGVVFCVVPNIGMPGAGAGAHCRLVGGGGSKEIFEWSQVVGSLARRHPVSRGDDCDSDEVSRGGHTSRGPATQQLHLFTLLNFIVHSL